MRRTILALASILVVPAFIYACGEDDDDAKGTTTPATEAGNEGASPTVEAGSPDTAQPDTTAPSALRCTQAELDKAAGAGGGDFTAFPGADITFPTAGAPAQYTNHCVKVKVGSKVTWAGSFASHPLAPNGGDTPNPIPSQSADVDGGAVSITFTAKGTFGFECSFHPSIMFGAVQVVP
jgi:plastocyanin